MKGALLVAALVVAATFPAAAQNAEPQDQARQRLDREQAEQFHQLAQGQAAVPAVHVWGMAADGQRSVVRIAGPGAAGAVPEQLIVPDSDSQWVYVIRGHNLYGYLPGAGGELRMGARVDLRSDEELKRAGGGDVLSTVPVVAQYLPGRSCLLVLRGGILRQYSAQLEVLTTFDLRTEAEK